MDIEEVKRLVKRFNWYRVEDTLLSFIVTCIIVTLFSTKWRALSGFFIFFFGSVFCIIAMHLFVPTATVLTNKSGKRHKILKEDCGDVSEIYPDEEIAEIDGVKIEGKVFKLNNGIHAVIEEDGRLRIKTICGKIVNRFGGGIKGTAPDEKWQALFDAE